MGKIKFKNSDKILNLSQEQPQNKQILQEKEQQNLLNLQEDQIVLQSEETNVHIRHNFKPIEKTGKIGVGIKNEKIDERKLDEKRYELEDGTKKIEIYSTPVHFINKNNGNIEEIDNTLELSGREEYPFDFEGYVNKKNNFKVKFSKNNQNYKYAIEKEEHSLIWFLNNYQNSNKDEIIGQTSETTIENKDVFLNSEIIYPKIFTDIDLKYVVSNNGIKEYIIVNKRKEEYLFEFNLKTKNLKPQLSEDGGHLEFISTIDVNSNKLVFNIPSPMTIDDNENITENVWYEIEKINEEEYIFKIQGRADEINLDTMSFPIMIDPGIETSPEITNALTQRMWYNHKMNTGYSYIGYYSGGISGSSESSGYPYERLYYKLDLSKLVVNGKITKVEFWANISSTTRKYYAMVGETNKNLDQVGSYTDYADYPDATDFNKITSSGVYKFDVTSIVTKANQEGKSSANFVLKGWNETTTNPDLNVSNYKVIVSYVPGEVLDKSSTFETNEVNRAGTGQINLFSGNLTFEDKIISWNGNRMPISVNYYFNNAYSSSHFIANGTTVNMQFGYGWKISLTQKIKATTKSGFNFEYFDEKGTLRYLKKKVNTSDIYVEENDSEIEYNLTSRTLTKGGFFHTFDTAGDLIEIRDTYNNKQVFLYNTIKQLVAVKDGANRTFTLNYSANKLINIIDPDAKIINFVYDGEKLSKINFYDGYSTKFTYIDKYLNSKTYSYLCKAINLDNNLEKYSTEYEYKGIIPKLVGVKEKNGDIIGKAKTINYESQTSTQVIESTDNANEYLTTNYQFDEQGNLQQSFVVENEQQVEVDISDNLIKNSLFSSSSYWTNIQGSGSIWNSYYNAYHGKNSLSIYSCENCNTYSYQTIGLYAGTYTFSTYVNGYTSYGKAYIEARDNYSNKLGCSYAYPSSDYQRLITTFTLNSYTPVTLKLGNCGNGTACFSAPQLEKASSAGNFNYLDSQVFRSRNFDGEPEIANTISQTIELSAPKTQKEEFMFSGWAKCYSPTEKDRIGLTASFFELRAELYYENNVQPMETEVAKFERNNSDWQKASLTISKQKYEKVSNIKVYFVFDNNIGTAYVKNFELTRNGEPIEVKYEDFEAEATDQGGSATEENSNQEFLPEVIDNSIDEFGNTKWNINHIDGEFGSIYQTFEYNQNGNDKTKETDDRNNETVYTYYENSSLVKTMKEPGKSLINFDYAPNKQISKISTNIGTLQSPNNITIEYAYDYLNNLTSINHNNFTYAINYNEFNNLQSIGIGSNNLVNYEYNNGSGRVKKINYANGSTMSCNYNAKGNMLSETWKKTDNTIQAKYLYSYDTNGNITKTIDKLNQLMYTYEYDCEVLKSSKAYSITIDNNESVTSQTLISEQSFAHNKNGKTINQTTKVGNNSYDYEYSYYDEENGKYTLKMPNGSVSTSKTDHLGRKEFDELQLKSGFSSRRYSYVDGGYDASKLNGELKSSPTTEFVSEILYENGDKLNYTYDVSGNISSVSFNDVLKESYSYDLLGRLKTEQNVQSGYLVVYSYDNGGNITSKKKYVCQSTQIVTSESELTLQDQKTYNYGNVWKDKLINYNGQSITYDACGNPTNYKGITATWEKGRQLKSFGSNTYKYNASGIRISKTVGTVEHEYTLNGSNIICEEIKDQNITTKLDYLYDIDTSVCGMRVNNGEYYFFRKNLQGDIIAITDNGGNIIANYRYDAWGKVLSITGRNVSIANLNPFRYRGYYYDVETQLYYLNSRYYDPEVCRFINSDDYGMVLNQEDLSQSNLFTYSFNSPINYSDKLGYLPNKINTYAAESWLMKLILKFCKVSRKRDIIKFNKLGFEMALQVGYDSSDLFPFSKNSLSASFKGFNLGLGWGKKLEITMGMAIGQYDISFMRGVDWKRSYLALKLGYTTKDDLFNGYIQLYISMKHILKLAIAALVVGACVLIPMIALAMSQFLNILLNGSRVAKIVLPKILRILQFAI